MKVILVNTEGYKDITQLVTSITWSGDYQQAARKLDITVAVSPHDVYLPKVFIGPGQMLKLQTNDGTELIKSFVFSRQKSYQGTDMQITAYDGLIYLTKSQMSYNFKNMTAEAITTKVCNDLGIIPGNIISTGIAQQSYLAQGKTGYEIIMTAYTAASKQNGKKYLPIMNNGKLDVIEKGAVTASYVLDNGLNLTNATYSDSLESMVNRVIITDDKGNTVGKVENAEWMKSYGMIQAIYQREQGKDANIIASGMLKGLERKASVDALGNIECITGRAIEIKEPYTGLSGLFFIDSDTHTWQNGQYSMNLTVSFQNMMDEKEG
jgi:hypothetical protein